MRERPILFSGAMVRAILDGRKTQTRRVVKLPPAPMHLGEWEPGTISADPAANSTVAIPHQACLWHTRTGKSLLCPIGQPGDRLWVRETWMPGYEHDAGHEAGPQISVLYGADKAERRVAAPSYELAEQWANAFSEDGGAPPRWRPSIHMPRWACRLVLEITDVRVERLQAISEADACAEGMGSPITRDCKVPKFAVLWDELNGAGAWDANPWVWVIGFKRVPA